MISEDRKVDAHKCPEKSCENEVGTTSSQKTDKGKQIMVYSPRRKKQRKLSMAQTISLMAVTIKTLRKMKKETDYANVFGDGVEIKSTRMILDTVRP